MAMLTSVNNLCWVCMTFSKMVYLWAVCCITLLVLNSSWALLVGFAKQQFCNAAPAGMLAVQLQKEALLHLQKQMQG